MLIDPETDPKDLKAALEKLNEDRMRLIQEKVEWGEAVGVQS
jgi:hypothetical protein